MGLFGKQKRGTSPILLVPKPTVGGTLTVKPSGKKTETETYLKNRKPPTTYKGTKFENKMRDKFNEARSKNQGILVTPEVEQYQKGKKY
jgi:hypothetical protein